MNPLETERTSLVTVRADHVARLAQLWLDEEVRRYLGGVVASEIALQRVGSYVGREPYRTVFRRESNEILGIVMLSPRDEDVEISYQFFPEYWGTGYAREAVARLIQFGFESLGCEQIVAVTQSENLRSVRLLESLSMQLCETFIEFSAKQSKYRVGKPRIALD